MIWRSILHAHLFSKRFGPILEFHTITGSGIGLRGFDELMHCHSNIATRYAQSLGPRRSELFKCCLILPGGKTSSELLRIGKHILLLLKLNKPVYYRLTSKKRDPNTKLTYMLHNHASEFRVTREEKTSSTSQDPPKMMAYQPGKTYNFELQQMGPAGGWFPCTIE